MSFVPAKKWDCLECGFMCAAMRTIQTHLKQQHNYEGAVSPENHPNVLVAVIASRLHDEECAWQTDAENRPDGDCECIGWEYSISDGRVLMRAVGYHNVTRRTRRRREDEASCEAPCKDVNDAGDESSGANKAQTMGEATEAKCDV
jgi:hypothetical protein